MKTSFRKSHKYFYLLIVGIITTIFHFNSYSQEIDNLNKKECRAELVKFISITDSLKHENESLFFIKTNLEKQCFLSNNEIERLKSDSSFLSISLINKISIIDSFKNENIQLNNKLIELDNKYKNDINNLIDSNNFYKNKFEELNRLKLNFPQILDTVGTTNFGFKTIDINGKKWMSENLNVDKFRNGEKIPQAKSAKEWAEMKGPKWCFYNFDPANGFIYGKLYNWEAVTDKRGLAPNGWHVPTDKEWKEMYNYFYKADKYDVENKLKSKSGWNDDVSGFNGGSNESGFNALPAGKSLQYYGTCAGAGLFAEWWTSSLTNWGAGMTYKIPSEFYEFIIQNTNLDDGHSIRCIQDSPSNLFNLNEIKSVKLGTQIWTVENLNVSKFLNGDVIKQAKNYDEWKNYYDNNIPAWCYYNFDLKMGSKYGKIYNYHAVVDERKIAPQGWHVPKKVDWDQLIEFLGGEEDAGTKMKNKDAFINDWATNSSEFNALPAGELNGSKVFNDISFTLEGWGTAWWSDYGKYDNDRIFHSLSKSSSHLKSEYDDELNTYRGLYVRCVKD